MERRTLLGRLTWQLGEVIATQPETARTKSITLTLPNWMGHRAGQHVDVRLTAEDGYQAERSYSIASPPEETPRVTLSRGCHLPRRPRRAGEEQQGVGGSTPLPPRTAAWLAGLCPPHRFRDATRGGLAGRAASPSVHLRPHPVRGNGRRQSRHP